MKWKEFSLLFVLVSLFFSSFGPFGRFPERQKALPRHFIGKEGPLGVHSASMILI
jgi:hypothetical protein